MVTLTLLLTLTAHSANQRAPTVRYQESLGYPALARELPLPPVICPVEVSLDAAGQLIEVDGDCTALFLEQARLDLRRWRFRPAHQGTVPVASTFPVNLRYAYRDVPPPDMGQWQWTDDSLVRLAAKDRTLAWGGTGAAVIGATTASLALMTDTFYSYRARYIAFGLGLTTAVIGAIFAGVHFGYARKRRQQRELWSSFRP